MTKVQVAIDGPASAGKSTVAKIVAQKFGYIYCDTGAMYRAITLKGLRSDVSLDNEQSMVALLNRTTIDFEPGNPQRVLVDNQDVTDDIRQEDVTNEVSTVAALKGIRAELVHRQRQIAAQNSVVMDGRDIGTTVLPNAPVKIFLVASVKQRALRRFEDNEQKGIHVPLDILQKEIEERDYKDSHRDISPLVKSNDAVEIDTTNLTIKEVVDKISQIIKKITNQ